MAAGISQDDIQKVREASDIVAIAGEITQLKQRGSEFWGCCPFHNEKTPSFKVDSSTQLWHCFGCGEGGDIFSFVQRTQDMTFPEAVRHLADRAHIDIVESGNIGPSNSLKKRLKDICDMSARFYHEQLMRGKSASAQGARDYLSGRGLGGDIPKEWLLGYAPGNSALFNVLRNEGFDPKEMVEANVVIVGSDGKYRDRFFNRVMFPIDDTSGECIAFGGRILDDGQPKYLNSKETPIFHKSQVLYGLDKAKAMMASTGVAIVAEGYTDVIFLHKAGIKNAVATLGTSLTRHHINQLSRHARKKIIYLFDGDEAGQRATERALQFIDRSITPEAGVSRIDLYALTLPDGLDPCEYISKYGAEEMKERIEEAVPLIAFGIEKRLSQHDISSVEGKSRALEDTLSILAPIKDSILAKEYAIEIASRLNLREQDVLDRLSKLVPQRSYEQTQEADRTDNDNEVAKPKGPMKRDLSLKDRNRLKLEREYLSLITQNNILAIKAADELDKVDWHDVEHRKIAMAILSKLQDDIQAKPVDLLEEARRSSEYASSILTSSTIGQEMDPDKALEFLSQELKIGDLENKINGLKRRIAKEDMIQSTADSLFEEMIELQRQLTELRKNTIPML